nr:hypothetical protein [Tanacetum cinerariifolium]
MVLGIQWLSTLGDIKCNFKELRMRFNYNGKYMTLSGATKPTVQWIDGRQVSKADNHSMTMCVYPTAMLNMITASEPKIDTHEKEVQEGTKPINIIPYRHPPTKKDAIKTMVKELTDSRVIRHRVIFHLLCCFSKLDLRSGYHQIRMYEDDIAKTTFKTHEGHLVFFDDILVYSHAMESHVFHLSQVLEVMRRHQLYAKKSKCTFGATQVEYLGHIITDKGVDTDPNKVKAMTGWPVPSNIKQLRGFLGLIGYYRRFAQIAFEELKEAMASVPVLQMPEFDKTFVNKTDTSGLGIGDVLQHDNHPIAFLSKTLAPKHQTLSTYEKEFLAVIDALDKWRGITTPAQMKWIPKLMGFDYEIIYKKGAENMVADALSRVQQDASLFQVQVTTLSSELYVRIQLEWERDDELQKQIKQLKANPFCAKHYLWCLTEISMDFIDGLPISKGRTVIMVIVDILSKYSHFIPLTHFYTAIQVAQAFLDNIYKLHGLPRIIVSDRDAVFMSRLWKELFARLQVKLHTSTSYHPQLERWPNRISEYWYNTSYHTAIKTTPYQAVYGQPPPTHISYNKGESVVEAVDRSLLAREAAIQLLKFHMKRAQDKMKNLADKDRSEREFNVDTWVYLKLQPYRQVTVRQNKHRKLSPKYFGPFKIIRRVSKVAYKLQLPESLKVHPVFHVLQLKKYKGPTPIANGQLPTLGTEGLILEEPYAVLDRRLAKRGNAAAIYVPIQ